MKSANKARKTKNINKNIDLKDKGEYQMEIQKKWAIPNANTFIIKPIKEIVEHEINMVKNNVDEAVIVETFTINEPNNF